MIGQAPDVSTRAYPDVDRDGLIIGPCTVVSGGPEPVVIEDAGVHVVGAHIAHVAHASTLAAAYPTEMLWPARGRVLMPGFVNTHAHLARHLGRGRHSREWARYERALSPEDVYVAAVAALAEGLRHGVTTTFDFHRSNACIELSLSEIVSAAADLGVRVATCYGLSDEDTPEERRAALHEYRSFADELRTRREGTLKALLGIRAGSLGAVERLMRESLDGVGTATGMHVDLEGSSVEEDVTLWLGDPVPTLWAHADCAPDSLIHVGRERGDSFSAVGGRHVRGASWGSDAGLNAPPSTNDCECFGEHVLLHGARWAAQHFGRGMGTIAPGAPADLVLLDYEPTVELTTETLETHLRHGLMRAPVAGVMVAGDVVLEDGRLTRVDGSLVAARARDYGRRLRERLG